MPRWKLRRKSESTNTSTTTVKPNLTDTKPYKDIILSKISCAVTYHILIHFICILSYVIIVKCSFTAPDIWLQSVFYSVTSFSFWFYIVPFVLFVFFKTIFSSKYLLTKTYEGTSTVRAFISSLTTNAIFLVLHTIGGGFAVWLYLSLSEDQYSALYTNCDNNSCLQEGGLFLILSGLWNGMFFYIRTQSSDKMLLFPTIQQSKFRHFKSEFLKIVNESFWFALYPTIYFCIIYFAFGSVVYQICSDFGIRIQYQQFGVPLYLFSWVLSSVYVMHTNLFEFLLRLFLTEQIHFPLTKTSNDEPCLSDALSLDTVPIIQQLACLDLYLLSLWSPQRRGVLYTLSQPGGHPHTWNQLIDIVLTLINKFTESLNNNIDGVSNPELARSQSISSYKSFDAVFSNTSLPVTYSNMRLTPTSSVSTSVVETQTNVTLPTQATIGERFVKILNDILDYIRNISIIKQLFGVSRDINVQETLKFGQSMELLILALANIVVVSVDEDPYGVIQRDIPDIITSLFRLKIALEKVNKSSVVLVKKNSNHSTVKMSNSVYSATKRSLIKICRRFRNYLHEFKLKKEIVGHLRNIF